MLRRQHNLPHHWMSRWLLIPARPCMLLKAKASQLRLKQVHHQAPQTPLPHSHWQVRCRKAQ